MMQLALPGIVSTQQFKSSSQRRFVRLRSFNFEEGIEYLKNQGKRKIDGHWVENCAKPSMTRLKMFLSGQIKCVSCGLEGDHFHIERHKNDKVRPFSINLYGWKGEAEVMMTWDHRLPKSLGGSNNFGNAQCLCTKCNSKKGNNLPLKELIEIASHKKAVSMHRIQQPANSLTILMQMAKEEFNNMKGPV